VPNLTGVTALTAGEGFTCARLQNGTAKCWGTNMGRALGCGYSCGDSLVPTYVVTLQGKYYLPIICRPKK
jgi:hypothetical protein